MIRAVLLLSILPATIPVASAQSRESVALLEHVLAEIRIDTVLRFPKPLGVDPRILLLPADREGHGAGQWTTRAPEDLVKLAAIPDVILMRMEDARQCNPALKSAVRCRLVGVASLLAFTRPTVTGETATVHMVGLTNAAGGRGSMNEVFVRYTLVRTAAGWRVTDQRVLAGT